MTLFPSCSTPGGRAWILDMMAHSPVGANDGVPLWEAVLTQTREVYGVLRPALQVISNSDITEHPHGAIRVLLAVVRVQRFDIAISTFQASKIANHT
ncbi:hypothetical protein O1611_g1561 [Lasiodiplodia mahajangana]|uniref:Uncharacterized protein n=1 Tax=Lasiodiplodia mahajangana TaxID=1108764 RepID=A0ACC2JXJ7_9PEZI|nr:hypothetical protein O1611_g1561 [Lasiodiplodia mahajangana]